MELLVYVMIFVILPVIALLAFIFIRVQLNVMKHIPGLPFRRPIFGTYIEYKEHNCALFDFIKNDPKKYGPIRTSYLFLGNMRLNVADPYWIKYILATNSKNYRRGNFPGAENIFFAVGQNGLVVVNGEKHKRLRKVATPAFKLSQMKKVMPIIEMCGKRMVNLIRTLCDENQICDSNDEKSTEIGVKEILNKTTLDVIGLIAFGHDFKEACHFDKDTFGYQLREWLDSGNDISLLAILPFRIACKRFIINMTKYLPAKLQNSHFFILAHTTNLIHNLVEGLVQSKIEEKQNKMINDVPDNSNSKTLLDFILEANDATDVNLKEVHDLLMTFLIAGHETSSLAITWTLYLLSNHPEYQQKCRKEANKFFDEHKDHVDWDDVHKLSILNAVVHESLRMYPPVPWLNRYTNEPDKIGGYDIPANCDIILLMCEMHRNEEYWTNPDDFIPERFLEPHDTIPWEAFMPFGDGIHKCIGYQLALTEILYLLAVLLKNFEFSIDASTKYRDFVVLTMQPRPALKLRVKVLL